MDINELKRVILLSIPSGLTADKRIMFSFDSLATSAALQGIELPSKSKTLAMLRSIGFTDAKSNKENRIAVPLRMYAVLITPVLKELTAALEG
jgi:hypothetical protein